MAKSLISTAIVDASSLESVGSTAVGAAKTSLKAEASSLRSAARAAVEGVSTTSSKALAGARETGAPLWGAAGFGVAALLLV